MDTCAFNFDGTVTPKLMPYMRNRAKGGVGLIIQECTDTSWPEGKNGPRELRMDVPDSITFLHDMTNVVHSFGTKIILQLNHAGFRSNPINCEGRQSVCPSDFMDARAMTHEEVQKVVRDFVICAKNAHHPRREGRAAGRPDGACGHDAAQGGCARRPQVVWRGGRARGREHPPWPGCRHGLRAVGRA